MTKTEPYVEFDVMPKPLCPDCLQPLTFVRTRSQQKKWYCYSCEKYTDHFAPAQTDQTSRLSPNNMNGLQVIDSHGMVVGSVSRTITSGSGDVSSLVVHVDKEPFRTSLLHRGIQGEIQVGHEKVLAIGDVVILSEVFSSSVVTSPSSLPAPIARTGPTEPAEKYCPRCGSEVLFDATFCIGCGRRI